MTFDKLNKTANPDIESMNNKHDVLSNLRWLLVAVCGQSGMPAPTIKPLQQTSMVILKQTQRST